MLEIGKKHVKRRQKNGLFQIHVQQLSILGEGAKNCCSTREQRCGNGTEWFIDLSRLSHLRDWDTFYRTTMCHWRSSEVKRSWLLSPFLFFPLNPSQYPFRTLPSLDGNYWCHSVRSRSGWTHRARTNLLESCFWIFRRSLRSTLRLRERRSVFTSYLTLYKWCIWWTVSVKSWRAAFLKWWHFYLRRWVLWVSSCLRYHLTPTNRTIPSSFISPYSPTKRSIPCYQKT